MVMKELTTLCNKQISFLKKYYYIYIKQMDDYKNKVIEQVYKHPIIGYGSTKSTWIEAKSINKDITLNDVKEYFSKIPSRQIQFKYRGYNSFVAGKFLEQIQIDIADFTKNAEQNDGYRYALVGIDCFSRHAWAVPMKTKQPHDVIKAFKEIIEKIGKPESIYSDMEGSLLSKEFIKLLNENNIKQITTLNHAPYAEVFIRTLKQFIHNRLEGENLNLDRWIDVLKPVLAKYNLSEHSSIKMSPYEAKQPKNKIEVYFNNWGNSKHDRIYKPLSVGDNVRIMIKRTNKSKGTDPKWSKEIYTIIGKNNNEYLINENNRRKIYLRHELRHASS